MSTKRRASKSKNPAGRPSQKLAEGSVLVTGPVVLLLAAAHRAKEEGITVREWWRRAARVRLGWREVLDRLNESK